MDIMKNEKLKNKIYSRIGDAGNINISYSSVVDIFG